MLGQRSARNQDPVVPQTKPPTQGKWDLWELGPIRDDESKSMGFKWLHCKHLTPWKPELAFNIVFSSGQKINFL